MSEVFDPMERVAFAIRAEFEAKDAEISALRGAIGWLESPFVDAKTSDEDLRKRVRLMLEDVARYDAIATEARRAETAKTGSVEDEGAGRNGIAQPSQPPSGSNQ